MTTAIIYWTGTGNTEAMAEAIAAGLRDKGAEAELIPVDEADAGILERFDKFAFGCPSMGDEVLEEDSFEPFFASIEGSLAGKKVALFGSYGWGDGEWMRNWQERTKGAGANLYAEGLIQNYEPDGETCREFGRGFADF